MTLSHDKFKKNLRLEIFKKYPTLDQFARDLDLNWTTLQRYVAPRGETWPKADKLLKMAQALDVSIEELLTGERFKPESLGAFSPEHLRLVGASQDPDVLRFLLQCLDAVEVARRSLKDKERRLDELLRSQEDDNGTGL